MAKKNEKVLHTKVMVVDGNIVSADMPFSLSVLGISRLEELLKMYEEHRRNVIRLSSSYTNKRYLKEKLWNYAESLVPVIEKLKQEYQTRLIKGI